MVDKAVLTASLTLKSASADWIFDSKIGANPRKLTIVRGNKRHNKVRFLSENSFLIVCFIIKTPSLGYKAMLACF